MNPAALKANIWGSCRAVPGTSSLNHRRVHQAEPRPRSATRPTRCEDGSLESWTAARGGGHDADLTDGQGPGRVPGHQQARTPSARRTCSRSALLSWLYSRPSRGHASTTSTRRSFAKKPHIAQANVAALKAGWNFGETTEDLRGLATRSAPAPMPAGLYRNMHGNTALAYGLIAGRHSSPSCRCSSAPTRSPRRLGHPAGAGQAQGVRRPSPSRPRTRSRRPWRRARRRLRWLPSGYHHDLRARASTAQGRDRRAGHRRSSCRSSSSTCSARARRPACRPRPSRPTCCWRDVRPPRRGSRSRSSRRSRPRLLRRRDRGGPDRDRPTGRRSSCSPTPTSPTAVRAVADPRGGRELPDLSVEFAKPGRTADGSAFLPYTRDPRPWPGRGRSPAPWARAPHRRHREGRRTGNISYDPANHDTMVRLRQAKIDGIAATIPPARGRRPDR